MARFHLKEIEIGHLLEPDETVGNLSRARLTASKRYEVLSVLKDGKDVFVTVEDDRGTKQTYSSLWFNYPAKS